MLSHRAITNLNDIAKGFSKLFVTVLHTCLQYITVPIAINAFWYSDMSAFKNFVILVKTYWHLIVVSIFINLMTNDEYFFICYLLIFLCKCLFWSSALLLKSAFLIDLWKVLYIVCPLFYKYIFPVLNFWWAEIFNIYETKNINFSFQLLHFWVLIFCF